MSSCWDCLKSCCCTDPWTQGPEWVGGGAAAGVSIVSFLSGNVPLGVAAGGAAVTGFVAPIRTSCLRPEIELSHTAHDLEHQVSDLSTANSAQATEIHELQESATSLRTELERLHKEQEEIQHQRETDIKRIADLTGQLNELQPRYAALQQSCLNIQRALGISQREAASAMADASRAIHTDEAAFADTVPLMAKSIDELKAAAAKAHDENARLGKLLEDLKIQESVLQSQITELQREKAAIERLVADERTLEQLEETIRKRNEELAAIQVRFDDIMSRLASATTS
jgi:chromosome segregation ATPase